MVYFSSRAVLALFILLCVSSAYGQTRVVVIPLGGDDAATTWRGSWETDTAYKKSDIVEFDGSSYIALLDHQSDLSNIPPDDTFWDLVAASGAKGDKGDTGDPVDAVAAICVALGSTAGCDLADVLAGIASTVYKIGDVGPGGGIVFYTTDNGKHGLEAAPADLTPSDWGCFGDLIGGTSQAIGTGAANTAAIIGGCVSAEVTAAERANDYELNGFTDWFLPSKDELNQLYLRQDVVGGFVSSLYWSSSENGSGAAWAQDFGSGGQGGGNKLNSLGVRAVRAF